MIRNYLEVAFRNLLRNKLTSFINIVGLATALACCLLIYLFISDELSYDRYNEKAANIYRIRRDFLSPDGSVNLRLGHLAPPFGPLLKNDFSEFEEVARTLQDRMLVNLFDSLDEPKILNIDNAYFAEPGIFNIFSVKIIEGNPLKGFDEPFKVMMSENTARKCFGKISPVGKRIRFSNTYDAVVTGVFRDFPSQSHWHPNMFVSFSTLNDSTIYGREGLETNWGNNSFGTYVLVKEPFHPEQVEARFPVFLDNHMSAEAAKYKAPMPSTWTRLYLQKLTDIHLYSHLDSEEETNGNITNVYMMAVIGLFIILIASFNFINLSTARATKRSKEVGIRKVSGAIRGQLISQFLCESVLMSLIALITATGISWFALDWLNNFTGKSLHVFNPEHIPMWTGMILFAVMVGILAGIYPAFVISGIKPLMILKSQQFSGSTRGGIRKILVVTQFAISAMLIISTAVTFRQLSFLNHSNLGYDADQVITLPMYDDLRKNYDAFYNELVNQASVKNLTRSSRIPTGRLLDTQGNALVQKGDSMVQSDVVIKNICVDHEFFNTYSIPFASGRNFSKDFQSDDSLGFILNEAAVKMLGLNNEEILSRDFKYANVKGRVIGVVRDFHFESLREPIIPMIFVALPYYNRVSVKIAAKDMKPAIANIEKVWKSYLPDKPFEFEFVSERYKNLYIGEQRQGQLFTLFSGLAIIIACLGLFGLATFNALHRVKEIGIRKVLGASVSSILSLLSKEIILLVIISNLIAWPVVWYFMHQWLDNFAYRINMNAGLFIVSGLFTILIALVTVGFQSIRAALANPADSLRNE
jgi:putative ABC transport system permease protein